MIQPGRVLRVPDLFYPEVGNVLRKKVRRRELETADARTALSSLIRLETLESTSDRMLAPYAMELALRGGFTVYDALYLSLAIQTESVMVTADRKLIANASKWLSRESITWVGDIE